MRTLVWVYVCVFVCDECGMCVSKSERESFTERLCSNVKPIEVECKNCKKQEKWKNHSFDCDLKYVGNKNCVYSGWLVVQP